MRKYHFISGLPRSGSTLLSSILKQNPRFTASISDPLHDYARAILQVTHQSVGMEVAVPIQKRADIIRGIFDSFYKNDNEVCFNTNRGWTATTSLIRDLYPNSKMLVCVRDVPWILDSFEVLNSKNPYTIKALYHHTDLGNVYDRTHTLMKPEGGFVNGPLTCLKQGLYSNDKDMLCVIDYDALTKNPNNTMQRIYKFLNEPWFEHDFDNVEDSYDEFDTSANIAGLHTIRKKVEHKQRKPVLPEDLWLHYSQSTFWKMDFDHIKSQINWIE